jgi:hypothetical protein
VTTRLKIRLHEPHKQQAAFKHSHAGRKVIVAGRRGGKTTGVADVAIEAMLQGHRVLEAAPTADQTTAFWDTCKKALAEPIAAGAIYKNESSRLLEMPGGKGRIRSKTAWDADSLRGDYADLLILDEYSIMHPSAWDEVGAPMLLDNGGDAIFIFTPKRKNHAFQLYQRAVGDDTGRWAAFHFTSHDNPFLDKTALAEITQDMGEEAYRQEILAEFLEGEGAVFRNIEACMHAPTTTPHAHREHTLVMGADWGKQADMTALSLGCVECRVEVAHDRFNQIDYAFQRARLTKLVEQWGVAAVLAESNAMGDPIVEELQRAGLPVIAFQTTAVSKPPLIENLALAFERAEWQFLADPIWTGELESYERKVSALTGRSSYSAPEGLHDDTVMARALMLWQATNSSVSLLLFGGGE